MNAHATPAIVRALVVAATAATPGAAQTSTVVDEGTFMVSRQGAPVGRESFKISRAPGPGGQAYRAVATSAIGDERISVALTTDSAGRPIAYDFQLGQHGEVLQRIQGRGRSDRFSILAQAKGGEAAREYVVRGGTLLLDEDVFHQFYFVARTVGLSEVTIIVPRTARQTSLRLEVLAPETVTVGGRAIAARHAALVDSAGIAGEWWSDAAGRLLKVGLPRRSLMAIRDDPPR